MNTAYAFRRVAERPTGNLNGCALFWRFLWFGLLKLMVNIFLASFVLPILALAWGYWVPYVFLFGRTIDYVGPSSEAEARMNSDNTTVFWRIFEAIPEGFFIFHYRSSVNRQLPRLLGYRVIPVVVMLCLAFLAGEVLLVLHIGSLGARDVLSLGDWSLRLMLAQLGIGVVALLVLVGLLIRRGEVGQLIAANWKSFKERTCPVVEIVG